MKWFLPMAALAVGLMALSPLLADDKKPEADKDGFGTALGRFSDVWFTLGHGEMTEVFFPRVDTPSTRDLGLVGGCGLIAVYLLIAERGFKTAMLATDSFSKLLATGLTAVLALQVFVIVGGVTKLIPLTGVTLPFISYGGSSIVANFALLALLLLVSQRARAPR